jgi:cold shock CspA family protein
MLFGASQSERKHVVTGRIKIINNASASGVIAVQNGLSVPFDLAAVLAFDQARLAVGQHVSFDLKGDGHGTAVNIFVQRSHHSLQVDSKQPGLSSLRYAGFDQKGSIRSYRFERMLVGEEKETFWVVTDMALFTRHHVGVQEGPALCLQLLVGELSAIDVDKRLAVSRSLAESDLVALLANKALLKARSASKRKNRAVGQAAHAGLLA